MPRRLKIAAALTSLFLLVLLPIIGLGFKPHTAHAAPAGVPSAPATIALPTNFGSTTFNRIYPDPNNSANAYAIDGSGNIWQTINTGQGWMQITTATVYLSMFVSKMTEGHVAAITASSLYVSTNGATFALAASTNTFPVAPAKITLDPLVDTQGYVLDKTNKKVYPVTIAYATPAATWPVSAVALTPANTYDGMLMDPAVTFPVSGVTYSTVVLLSHITGTQGTISGTFSIEGYQTSLLTSSHFFGSITTPGTTNAVNGVAMAYAYGSSDTLYILLNSGTTATPYSIYYVPATASASTGAGAILAVTTINTPG